MRVRFGVIFFFLFTLPLWAGGPLQVWNDQPVVWDASAFPVLYHLDQGALGVFSAEEAQALITEAFDRWSSVQTSAITFAAGEMLPVDVDETNYLDYLSAHNTGYNPIIFDDDGSITDAIFGQNSKNDILGFAGISQSNETTILSSQAVFNGAFLIARNLNAESYRATVLHELGHWIGLDHSQLMRHLANDGIGWNDVWTPIMFPTTTDDESRRTILTDDDQWALSTLYPADGFYDSTGSIHGRIQQYSEARPGLNVIARRVGSVTDQIYSTVSGAFDTLGGSFDFRGLPPGDYQLYIEPIDRLYRGSSSVGRYAATVNSLSFRDPPPAQYYEKDGELSNRSHWTPIPAEANGAVNNIEFFLNYDIAAFEEYETQLLGLPDVQAGAAPANASMFFQFILTLNGTEASVEIEAHSDPDITFDLLVGLERRPGAFDLPTTTSINGKAQVVLTPSSDPPLQLARYFISLRNRSDQDASFQIQTQIPKANTLIDFEKYR